MVDAPEILKSVAVPMSHTPTGILKVEILGGLLVVGVLLATYGFRRWYLMSYEDWLLLQRRNEKIEELECERKKLIEAGKEPGIDFKLEDYEINPEEYEPPMRSQIVNYILFGTGLLMIGGSVATWLIIPP